jgi:hypothetical protein
MSAFQSQCYSPCVPIVKEVISLLEDVTEDVRTIIGNVQFGDDFTAIAMTPFINLLIDTTTNLTEAGLDHDKIVAIAGTVSSSIAGLIQLFEEVQDLFPDYTHEENLAVLGLLSIVPVLQQLVTCTGSTSSDCVGIHQLYDGLSLA